ncbi:palmitoyl-CoA hydrolase NDAI_0C02900 [Naumovozyma dairenensis CBS 421]|uniref:Acyl-CoA thioesterase II n=1 Tax=Naumovozyma dairenensis (strain ATCC 10597 / BCRC 20456 / CBS 421 / NBRC 0211 / NRRL Y-12639) TaxID=1071378 RepID=G0W839_NAUDC|nr:hypothetical protein NDAI_0C02900 [Naumovozyma dairenensis CBS 421]CCD23950.1 hypothetical protein NDAI_0C02900 [Naumovozyma dairenensis CBS 421]
MSKPAVTKLSKLSNIEHILELVPVSSSKFLTKNLPAAPLGSKGTFGGTLVAQSLLASLYTIPKTYVPTSMHCYFINGGDPKNNILYHVEKLRDGKNFIHRQIRAYQHDKLIFQSMILFSQQNSDKDHDSLHHLDHIESLPSTPPPDKYKPAASLYTEKIMAEGLLQRYARLSDRFKDINYLKRQVEVFEKGAIEYNFPNDLFYSQRRTSVLDYYVKIRHKVIQSKEFSSGQTTSNHNNISSLKIITPDTDPRYNYVAFAYLSDSYLLLTLPYFHQLPLYSHKFSVSLDHSIYFHQLPLVNNWIYLRIKNSRSHWDKHLVQGEYFDSNSGNIIATVSQEGLVVYDPEEEIKAKF